MNVCGGYQQGTEWPSGSGKTRVISSNGINLLGRVVKIMLFRYFVYHCSLSIILEANVCGKTE